MARIRSIKPEFWTSEQVVECSTNARLLFVGTWSFADDTGRHPYSARRLKMCVFPGDQDITIEMIEGYLCELIRAGLIVPYVVAGKQFFYVTGWEHQKIDKPQPSKYPSPTEADGDPDCGCHIYAENDHSPTIRRTLPERSPIGIEGEDRIGEDRIGVDRRGLPAADKPAAESRSLFPSDDAVDQETLESPDEQPVKPRPRFQRPTLDEVRAYCQERGRGVDPERWLDHYTANGWRVGKNPMQDWRAAVRQWEGSLAESLPMRGGGGSLLEKFKQGITSDGS